VVCLVGDGAALYSPQAIWTAAHEKLPVTFVVMNNREYNTLKNFLRGQENYLSTRSKRFIAMDIIEPAIDYLALAQSMGAGDIAPSIEAGIASGQANLIEIIIGLNEAFYDFGVRCASLIYCKTCITSASRAVQRRAG
jgi:benzoylformate decarboxylase